MHDQVRVAANRRREVQVGLRAEPEVADVAQGVARLLHASQRHGGHEILLGTALHRRDQAGHVERPNRIGRQRLVEDPRHTSQPLESILRRRLVDPIQHRQLVFSAEPGDRLVREDHQVLDDPVRLQPRTRVDRGGTALLVQLHVGLRQGEVDGATLPAPRPDPARDLRQLAERLRTSRRSPLSPSRRFASS